jgi:glyoxylase-like metal-dependent hydrolase (beta-lactamase superfamily II)
MAEVAPGVTVTQSRYWATNTTRIDGPRGPLLVDPGVYPDELAAHAAACARPPEAGVHTHAHWDHVLWSARLGADTARFVTDGTATVLERDRPALLAELDEHAARLEHAAQPEPDAPSASACRSADGHGWDGSLVALGRPLADGAVVPWSGPEARLLQTDAHVPGHGSVHLPGLGVLLAGDLVSDVDVPFPYWLAGSSWPTGVGPYRAGLDRIARLSDVRVVVPGHGTPTDQEGLLARLDADRRYLDRLEAVVATSATAGDAVSRAAGVDPRLHDPAVRAAHDDSVRALFAERSAR